MNLTKKNPGRSIAGWRSIAGLSRIAWLLAILSIGSGCAETAREEATGKSSIRGINSIVTSPELAFLIEERAIGGVNFRGVAGFAEWDDLSYNFNFDLFLPGATEPDRLATQFLDVVADTEYTLVLTGTIANPSILVWEEAEREWDGTETVFEADFVHLSPLLGQVDVYFALEGTAPVPGTGIGTLNNGDRLPYREFPEGDYELIVTAPGDPATELLRSTALTRTPAERVTVAIFDPDPSRTANASASIIFSGGAVLTAADVNAPSQIRLLNAAFGSGNFDGYFNNDFGNVIFPNVGFGEQSGYADLPGVITPLTITPAGDSSTTIVEGDVQLITNSRQTVALFGQPGTLFSVSLLDDARPFETFPVVRFTNYSSNIESLDIYQVDPGTVLDDDVLPRFAGTTIGISSGFVDVEAGMREFVITALAEKTPLSMPLVLDLAVGSIVDVAILDTADPAVVELRVIESFP